MFRIILCASLIGISGSLIAQHKLHKIEKALKHHHMDEAWELIQDNLEKGDNSPEINYYAAIVKVNHHEPDEALRFLSQTSEDIDKDYYLYKAKALLLSEHLGEALEAIKLSEEKYETPIIQDYIESAKDLVSRPDHVVVRDMSEKINSKGHEYNALMTDNRRGIIFTVRRKDAARTASDGMAYEQIFQAHMDSLDHWQEAKKVKTQSAAGHHDATIQLLENGNEMITYHDGDLFIVEREGDGWKQPVPLEIINTYEGLETHAFFTPNKDTLFFSTDYYTGSDLDLYMITYQNEQWSDPVPLEGLNTIYNDDAPFLAHDGSFYFSSKGHNSMGGYDVFRSRMINGQWKAPENMGYLINSTADDIYYSTHGKIAYLSSNRRGGMGKMDIYQIYLFDEIRVAGQVINKVSQKAIPGAKIIVSEEGEEVSATTDERGVYQMIVPIEKDVRVRIEVAGKVVYENSHRFRVLFRNENVTEVDMEVDLMTGDAAFGEILTVKLRNDENSDPLAEIDLDQLDLVEVEEVIPEVEEILEPEPEKKEPVALDPKRNGTMEVPELPTVYFGFDQATVRTEYHESLKLVAKYLIDNSRNRLMIVGYTDDKGSVEYNRRLSKRRAENVLTFLRNQGVDERQLQMAYKGELSGDADKSRRVSIELQENFEF